MTKELTFNDLPMVVAQLRDEVVGMKQMIVSLQSQNKPHKANTHIPMSVEEASAYLKMPMATLYMKLGSGSIRPKGSNPCGFSTNGRMTDKPFKGLNIWKMGDGTTRKVMMK